MARVKLGDVAREYKATIKNSAGLPVVGLEHLTPGEITLERWDMDTENTFTKGFKKGHMLFGRRRAYLKKAALAPFDGICSGDITVIEAIPGKINPELLPFIIQNDLLFDYAVGNSAGSLSPRVKWESLKDYQFELPELSKQDGLVELLKAAHRAKAAYRQQIIATDELVKSQFIEMFGDLRVNSKHLKLTPLSELILIERGGSPRPIERYITDSPDGVNWIKIGDAVEGSIYITHTKERIIKEGTKKSRYVQPGDFLLSNSMSFGRPYILMIDGYIHDGWLVLRDNDNLFNKIFLHTLLSSDYAMASFESMAAGSVVKNLNKELVGKLKVPVPDINTQNAFAAFAEQSDKSKFELQEAIVRIDNLIKSLIQQDTE